MKNILITSAGRRVSLVNIFKQYAKIIDRDIKVFTADMNPIMAAACYVSDAFFELPKITSSEYIEKLIETCKSHSIGIIIPTIDTCLPILARNKQRFASEGIQVIVSDNDFVDLCCDKRKTFRFFEAHGIRCPKMIDVNNPKFPMFAKPYDGSSSKDIHTIMTDKDLSDSIKNNPKLMFMELLDKAEYKELTVDMYFGRDNNVKCIVPRERIEVRGGEVSKGITRKNYLVDFLKEHFEHLPGVIGCICIQLFYRERDRNIFGIEINPRFGGGYPLSFHAGANFPLFILKEYLRKEEINYSDSWEGNTIMLRYDAEIITHGK